MKQTEALTECDGSLVGQFLLEVVVDNLDESFAVGVIDIVEEQ